MKTKRLLSVLLALAIIMSQFVIMPIITYAAVSGTDFSAFEKYGVYTYAGDGVQSSDGLHLVNYADDGTDTRLYHMTDDKAAIDADAALTSAYSKAETYNAAGASYQYVSRASDGAWDYRKIGDENAFWTTNYVRNRDGDSAKVAGSLYFAVENDVINQNINDVTFIIEYYDNTTADIVVEYTNTNFDNVKLDSSTMLSNFTIDRNNSGAWETVAVNVDDASFDKSWTNTGLCNGKACIKLKNGSADTYVRKVLVIPTVLYNAILESETGIPQIQFGAVNHYVNGTETESFVPAAGDTITSKITTFGAGNVTLISALYNRDELRTVVYDKQIVTETSVLETTIEVPNTQESWEYKCFVWDGVDTLYPFVPSNEELVLKASGTINSVSLVWDSADGNMESVDLYRDGEKIATVTDGIGGYIDDVAPGTYSYYIKNASGRTSDIITATSIDLFDHVEDIGGVYIQAGSARGTDITYGLTGMNSSVSYMDGTDSASKLSTEKYYQAYKTTSDSGMTRVQGTMYPASSCTPQAEPFTTVPEKITATDGISWAFFQPGIVYRDRGSSNGGVVTTSSTRMSFKIDPTKFTAGERNYTVFVEYWGTRTNAIGFWHTKATDTTDSETGEVTTTYGWNQSRTIAVDSTASEKWKVGRVDIDDAEFGISQCATTWDTGMNAPVIAVLKNNQDLYVRRIVIVPTKKLSSYGTSWYTGSQSTRWINNITQEAGHFGPSTDYFRQYGNTTTKSGVVDFTQLTSAPGAGTYGSDGLQLRTQASNSQGDGYTEFVLKTDTEDGYLKMYENPNRTSRAIAKHRWSFDDDYIYGMRDSSLQVAITYRSYNVSSGKITYSKASSGSASEDEPNLGFVSTSKTINFNTDGELHTLVVDLEDVNSMSHVFCESTRNDFAIEAGVKDPDSNIDGYDSEGNPYFLAVYRVEIRRPDNRLMQDLSK